ncbi:MAG: glycine--tRNA ligase subunit beta [Deltaproteobacteria bacterium]|nr:glycine--tRNA ligase subunit beta [Deltaproteobacteria bacterium]
MEQDLLLEIGTEEIPARFISGALEALKNLARERFQQSRLQYRDIKTVGTPRRLTLLGSGVSPFQDDKEENIMGPPKSSAFDRDGLPTKVALGFAKAKGVGIENLEFFETPKGVYLGLKKKVRGLPAVGVLAELLPQLILDLPFPKFMRWGTSSLRFARPIHWIVALFGEQVIPFVLGGIESGNQTAGHRFMAPKTIPLREAGEYLSKLRQAMVIADPQEREDRLRSAISGLAEKAKGKVLTDSELIQEVNFLVEFPDPVSGGFNPEFLKLPPEVLITSMKEHQRYFPMVDEQGNLLPGFIAVNNTQVKDTQRVVRGHEKVLRARLSDARFFFEEDLKKPLSERVEGLKAVVFHSRLGTSFEKVERIVRLAAALARKLAPEKEAMVKRCAFLCKADLISLMVGEFPNLQGIMGREYALRSGEEEETARGIFEHYLPVSVGSPMPETITGTIVGLADRLDTLTGFFGLGQIPSGSADPYALRRQAQAVIQIIWNKGYSLSINEALDQALIPYTGYIKEDPGSIKKNLLAFLVLRLQHLLEVEEGAGQETVQAVIAAGWDDVDEVRDRVLALQAFQSHPDFPSLVIGCKRALNILKGVSPSDIGEVHVEWLVEPEEKELFEKVDQKKVEIDRFFRQKEYSDYLLHLAQLRPTIDVFFDKVLVMSPDERIRKNRLALLFQLTALFSRFALFSQFDALL